ncbi:hypothetical protein KTAU_40500 [Thermogemmatispora aurantia]|uniref:hypothetical protein n=1 Tax=Thermogemmatispora TaxID=768669 RepID=UPI00085394DB|nr:MULTISPECIES: hypothetical protein [Thermogemmatispora]GER85415.1 hypothetical protein KTAU_40500 [Thermogemmatispora aurantia]
METRGERLRNLFVSPNRVVEIVQAMGELVPLRQFRLLFPLWRVSISGRQYEKRPYELLERFLERAIGEAELRTAAELVRFFGLPPAAVAKMLDFLRTVGHVSGDDADLRLTELGQASLQSGLFLRPLESQRLLYFEAFDSQPLPRSYYERESLILSEVEAEAARLGDRTMTRLYSDSYFDPERLRQLARRGDREQYNLPSELELGPNAIRQVARAYFPLTVVEAHAYDEHYRHAVKKRYLAFSPVAGYRDLFFERLIQGKPAIAYSFPELDEGNVPKVIERYASRQGLQLPDEARIARNAAGLWQLVLSPRLFQAASTGERQPLRPSDVGNVRQENGYFFQLWCKDEQLRRRSALEQTLLFVEREQRRRQPLFRGSLLQVMGHICKRLAVPVPDWPELVDFAREQGREDLLEEFEA